MDLRYRPAVVQDAEACLEMLPPVFAGAMAVQVRMADAWRSWLREGVMQMTVLEDGNRPPGLRRIAFGNSVFIGEFFAEEAKTSLPPPLGAQVVRRWREGRSPVLGLDALRAANSGPGLTLLILHIGWMPKLPAEEVRWAKGKLLGAMLDCADDEVAESLSVSASTVQKRWRAVYERIRMVELDFSPSEGVSTPHTRGAAKRRHLLGYLRSHPEELRLVSPPKCLPLTPG